MGLFDASGTSRSQALLCLGGREGVGGRPPSMEGRAVLLVEAFTHLLSLSRGEDLPWSGLLTDMAMITNLVPFVVDEGIGGFLVRILSCYVVGRGALALGIVDRSGSMQASTLRASSMGAPTGLAEPPQTSTDAPGRAGLGKRPAAVQAIGVASRVQPQTSFWCSCGRASLGEGWLLGIHSVGLLLTVGRDAPAVVRRVKDELVTASWTCKSPRAKVMPMFVDSLNVGGADGAYPGAPPIGLALDARPRCYLHARVTRSMPVNSAELAVGPCQVIGMMIPFSIVAKVMRYVVRRPARWRLLKQADHTLNMPD